LSLVVSARRRLSVALGYDPDLFDAATIERMVGHLAHLLDGIAADPSLPLGRIDILSEEERHQVLAGWNDTGREVAPARLPVLLTDRVWEVTARVVHDGPIVVVDADASLLDEPADSPCVALRPDNLAYVMHTSGSTGRPKGVAVRHRDVVALAFDRCFRGGGHEAVLLHSPLAFDASTYELWVPLLNGGRVVVVPPGDLDVDVLGRMIGEQGVTGLWL